MLGVDQRHNQHFRLHWTYSGKARNPRDARAIAKGLRMAVVLVVEDKKQVRVLADSIWKSKATKCSQPARAGALAILHQSPRSISWSPTSTLKATFTPASNWQRPRSSCTRSCDRERRRRLLRTQYDVCAAARTEPASSSPRVSVLISASRHASSTTCPSRSVTRRSICAAMSRLCVAMMAARPEARTS